MDKIYFYILLLGYVTCFDLPPDWINPSDLHHSRKVGDLTENVSAKPESISHDQVLAVEPETMIKNASSCICPPHQQSPCDSYMKRIINLLLLKTNMKNYRLPEDNNRIVPMALYFTPKNLEILHVYASSDTYETLTWSDFDQAFSSLFEIPEITKKSEEHILPQKDYAVFIFISVVGSMLIVGLWLLLKSGSFYKTMCGIAVINFCCALVWNLIRAYNKEKEKIVQLLGSRLISDQNKSSWWEFLNPRRNDDILLLPEYDPMFNIDYGKIVVETLSSVFYLLPMLGQHTGDMVANFYNSQNWIVQLVVQPLQWFISPVILITFLLLFAIVMKGFTIKLPLITLDINKEGGVQHQLDASQQQRRKQRRSLQPTVRAHIEDNIPVVANQEDVNMAGPSRGTVSLKRPPTEYISTESPVRNTNQRLPAVTRTRKGPWQGSIIRYGFIRKIVLSRNQEEFGN